MNLFNDIPTIPVLRPFLNIGAGLDIPTGSYYFGENGESILNGGLCPIFVIAGPQNTFKTTLINSAIASVLNRHESSSISEYCSEGTLTYTRVNSIMNNERYPNICNIPHGDETLPNELKRLFITSNAEMTGDEYFAYIKNIALEKRKAKEHILTTPFINAKGERIKVIYPTLSSIDSFSNLSISTIVEKTSGNKVGDSKNNTIWLNEGSAKKQLVSQLPNLTANCGMYFILTAHVSNDFEELQGQYAPKKPRLTYSKSGTKLSGAVKSLEWLANCIWEIQSIKPLSQKTGSGKEGVKYPLIDSDREDNSTDMLEIKLCLTRNKHGRSGAIVTLVLSQREGLLPHLSQFHYIKENDSHSSFGIEGNDRSYYLSLCPDIKLQRTTVRENIDSNYKLRRALEITSQLLQIKMLWDELPDDLWCTPKELYDDLKNKGYDWNELLETREWWKFKESNDEYPFHFDEEKPYLSTLDLLRMRKDFYKPYWMK